MDILETTQYLVDKVANVIISKSLVLEEFVKISFHECLNDIDVLHVLV